MVRAHLGDFAGICGDAAKHIKWAGRLCKERRLYNQDPFKSAEMIYTPDTDIFRLECWSIQVYKTALCEV
jgi:hypothetical protein